MKQHEAEKIFTFRIGSNPVGKLIFANSETEAWEQINVHHSNCWVELEHEGPNPYKDA
jgi:hypothetical protein